MMMTRDDSYAANEAAETSAGSLREAMAADDGFTLMEIIAVMIIVSILMGIGMVTMQNARENARAKQVIASAGAYRNAVAAFQLEHGNRVPQIGAREWPTARRTLGPVDIYDKPYLRGGPPEAIEAGLVGIGTTPAMAAGTHGRLIYTPTGSSYKIAVWVLRKETWKLHCETGPAATPNLMC